MAGGADSTPLARDSAALECRANVSVFPVLLLVSQSTFQGTIAYKTSNIPAVLFTAATSNVLYQRPRCRSTNGTEHTHQLGSKRPHVGTGWHTTSEHNEKSQILHQDLTVSQVYSTTSALEIAHDKVFVCTNLPWVHPWVHVNTTQYFFAVQTCPGTLLQAYC